MSPSNNLSRAAVPTGFEAGAKVANASQPIVTGGTDWSQPLETQPGEDHMAAVEARRVAMVEEVTVRMSALKDRATELRRQAGDKEREFYGLERFGSNATERPIIEKLKTEVADLRRQANALINIELPKLQAEAISIAAGTHPVMENLRRTAECRIRDELAAEENRQWASFIAARNALDLHLAKIATPETLRLATALADLCTAQKRAIDQIASRLLAAHELGA